MAEIKFQFTEKELYEVTLDWDEFKKEWAKELEDWANEWTDGELELDQGEIEDFIFEVFANNFPVVAASESKYIESDSDIWWIKRP